MGPNRVFFPQAALDQWVGEDRVDLLGSELVIKGEGRRYRVVEAVRVLTEVTGGTDIHELVGRVKSINYVSELGAELFDTSMILGDLAYEVIPGFMGTPVGTLSEHRAASVPPPVPSAANSDEEMLAQFLMKNLE
ncbi:MAG: hypothetical protein KC776_06855 [Myxococcales bacterium]|nr:hypothetical protein [Myxococcales bacterium]MCB9579183.1 hypothetical protein [Polyangiaceae bacterium]